MCVCVCVCVCGGGGLAEATLALVFASRCRGKGAWQPARSSQACLHDYAQPYLVSSFFVCHQSASFHVSDGAICDNFRLKVVRPNPLEYR